MPFENLNSFVKALEQRGDLKRVGVEVDPQFELTEVANRLVREGGPAVVFERVIGSTMPLVLNVLASESRIELALGRHPQRVGEELKRLMEAAQPPTLQSVWRVRDSIPRVLSMRPRYTRHAPVQRQAAPVDLTRLPIMRCWPGDAGRFITFGLVITADPVTRTQNMGVYRMQVVGPDRVLMHWQIERGGGFHYARAEQLGQSLDVAVVIGADPLLLMAAVAPLPEGMDEIAFAGFLRGRPVPVTRGTRVNVRVPAEAQAILEGVVPPYERMPEGPFGDHFGHYSHPSPFPVCELRAITQRPQPLYLSAIVGKPPQEDKFIGNAVQEMTIPLLKVIHPELRDFWAYYEAGFHSFAAVSVDERYAKEGMKTALGLLGQGQLALTKCLVVVDADVHVRDFTAILKAIRAHFNPAEDFLLLPGVPFDTLDFTSQTLNVGSKMVLDATHTSAAQPVPHRGLTASEICAFDRRITDARLVDETLLLVRVEGEGRPVVEMLVAHPHLQHLKLIATVSPDVNLQDRENWMWGLFTRFDPARDVVFTQAELKGSWPVYRGVLGIDATFKSGYPDPVVMHEDVIQHVAQRWDTYWQ